MPLVTPTDVRAILELPDSVSDAQLNAFIADADLVVTEDLAKSGLSTARLTVIEKYIVAHLVVQLTERGGLSLSKNSDAEDRYTDLTPRGSGGKQRAGYQLTRYGQQAIMLDTSGTLYKLSIQGLTAKFSLPGRTATRVGVFQTEEAEEAAGTDVSDDSDDVSDWNGYP